MPWSSGTFSRTNGVYTGTTTWQQDYNASSPITYTRHDTHDNDFRDGINNCLTKDGQNTPTANLPMGGFIHTGAGSATARTHYMRGDQVQDGTWIWGGTGGGSANAQTITLSPAIASYPAGRLIRYKPAADNTGATTINVNSVSARSVLYRGQALVGGELTTNVVAEIIDDGTNFHLLNHAGAYAAYTPTIAGSGAMTVGSTTIHYARYQRHGLLVQFQVAFVTTTGGVASNAVGMTIPIASGALGADQVAFLAWNTGATYGDGYGVNLSSTNSYGLYKEDRSNFTLAAHTFWVTGEYYTS